MYLYLSPFVVLICVSQTLVQCSEKKGVVHWAPSFMCDDFKVLNNMTWWYDFRMSLNYFHEKDICSSTINNYTSTHVPMVWGFWKNTKIKISNEAQYVLGFNEPNHKKQSSMTPKRAADAWPEMERNSSGKPLVSPSAAVCGAECLSDEIKWFDEFFKLCKGCRVDYLATHSYWCDANKVMTYLKKLYERFGRKIWLTEFACSRTKSPAVQLNFMKQILPKLEAAKFIYRYAWYSARITKSGFVTPSASLLEADRSVLTKLGQYYNDFQRTPDGSKSSKPSQKKNDTSSEIAGKLETMLMLQSIKANPTPWLKVIRYMKDNIDKLPVSVREVYISDSKSNQRTIKKRIKERLREILCTDDQLKRDKKIRELVESVRNLPMKKKKQKNDGNLRVPKCSKT